MQINEIKSRICVLTPATPPAGYPLLRAMTQVLKTGVGMVQYRTKDAGARTMVERATRLVRLTRAARVPLIINDRVDVALAAGADGVIVGAEDLQVAYCRRLLGPSAIVGATAPAPADARIAQVDGATFVLVGPVYGFSAEPDRAPLGLEGIEQVRAATGLPVCAVGGITPDHLQEVADAGADLVAVMLTGNEMEDEANGVRELVERAASFRWPQIAP